MEEKKLYDLTHRKLTGQITGAELLLLEELSKDAKNKELISEIESVWAQTADIEDVTFDHSAAYQKFLKDTNQTYTEQVTYQPRTRVVRLWQVATAVAAVFILGLFVFQQFQTNILSHSYDEGAIFTLEDQSKIYLSEGSQINYPENFVKDRSIELKGKAVFEVAKNQGSEFSVMAGNTKITVLGTTFLVETDQDRSQNIEVIEGQVKVDNDLNQIVISDREGVEIEPDGSFEKKENLTFAGTTIYQPTLVYNNSPLTKVLADLEVKFNIQFSAKSRADYSNCKFTSKDLADVELDEIITILKTTFNADINPNEEGVYEIKRLACR